jgi:hypothetical protein
MTPRASVKNSHFDDDFDFGIKKTDTYSQGYYCQTTPSPQTVAVCIFEEGVALPC